MRPPVENNDFTGDLLTSGSDVRNRTGDPTRLFLSARPILELIDCQRRTYIAIQRSALIGKPGRRAEEVGGRTARLPLLLRGPGKTAHEASSGRVLPGVI